MPAQKDSLKKQKKKSICLSTLKCDNERLELIKYISAPYIKRTSERINRISN